MKDFTLALAGQKGLKLKDRISILRNPRYVFFENLNEFIQNRHNVKAPLLDNSSGGKWFNSYFAFFEEVYLIDKEEKSPFYLNSDEKQFYNMLPVFEVNDLSTKKDVFWPEDNFMGLISFREAYFAQGFRSGKKIEWLQLLYDSKYDQASIYDLHVEGAGFNVERLLRQYSTYAISKLSSLKRRKNL